MSDTRPGWTVGEQRTVLDVVAKRLDRDPDGAFLDFDGSASLTARQLDELARAHAAGLVGLGVGKGDRVAMLLDNGPEIVVAWLAALRLGAICVPVNTANRGEFLRHQLADCGARVLVCHADYLDRVTAVRPGVPDLETILQVGEGNGGVESDVRRWDETRGGPHSGVAANVQPGDLATFVYTAGTTGPSKACMLSHNYVVNLARQIAETWQRRPDDVVWTPLPLFHLNAWVIAVLGTMLVGNRAAISKRFSVSGFWPEMNRSRATIASLLGSPAVLLANAEDDPAQHGNESLRLVCAAPMNAEIDARWRSRFGVDTFSAGYGLTEASLISALPPGERNEPGAAGRVNDREFEVRVLDDTHREVPPGEAGEICIRPRRPNVMFSGYWNRPADTLELLRDLWFHTGDIGRVDESGFLFFVDRKKDYLRRRGENVSSFEMEATFLGHEDIAEVCVHAVPSPQGEDDIKVTAVLREGATVTPEGLCRWSIERVPYFAVPRYVEFRDELPRNPVGRVLKYVLRDEGATASTWDREAVEFEMERR